MPGRPCCRFRVPKPSTDTLRTDLGTTRDCGAEQYRWLPGFRLHRIERKANETAAHLDDEADDFELLAERLSREAQNRSQNADHPFAGIGDELAVDMPLVGEPTLAHIQWHQNERSHFETATDRLTRTRDEAGDLLRQFNQGLRRLERRALDNAVRYSRVNSDRLLEPDVDGLAACRRSGGRQGVQSRPVISEVDVA